MIKYQVTVLEISDDIEELVLLNVNGIKLNCFASICPYPIEVGKQYQVTFSLFAVDDILPTELSAESSSGVERDGENLRYSLKGTLANNILDCGIKFEDPIFYEQYSYLNGKKIQLDVDRIDVEFL